MRIVLAVAVAVAGTGVAIATFNHGNTGDGAALRRSESVESFHSEIGKTGFHNTVRQYPDRAIACDTNLMLEVIQNDFPEATSSDSISCTDNEVILGINLGTGITGNFDAYLAVSDEGGPELYRILDANGNVFFSKGPGSS